MHIARLARTGIFGAVTLRVSELMDCISCYCIVVRNTRRWVKVQSVVDLK